MKVVDNVVKSKTTPLSARASTRTQTYKSTHMQPHNKRKKKRVIQKQTIDFSH